MAEAPDDSVPSLPEPAGFSCGVVELRQYTLHPGQRERLIGLFDTHLVEPQERAGMRVLGQFRDLDDPDRFVWLRGFPDPPTRPERLAAFYGGPVWAAHRAAANATMRDSDDVLLLRPVPSSSADPAPGRPAGRASRSSLITATIYSLPTAVDAEFLDLFAAHVEPVLAERGSLLVAALETEPAANDFPALPVREGEHVYVRLAREATDLGTPRPAELPPALEQRLAAPPQRLRLAPTSRSRLR